MSGTLLLSRARDLEMGLEKLVLNKQGMVGGDVEAEREVEEERVATSGNGDEIAQDAKRYQVASEGQSNEANEKDDGEARTSLEADTEDDEGVAGAKNGEGKAASDEQDTGEGGEHDGDSGTNSSASSNGFHSDNDSWASAEMPPLELNYEALKHTATYFLPGSHGACIDITTLERGTFHEVRVLHFEDGWSCIGRFTRDDESLCKTESELATMENHAVGASFVLMEMMPGVKLSEIWIDLTMDHRLAVLEQIAQVVAQLADLRFDSIGSLTSGGKVGPLLNISREMREELQGPFSTTLDYFCATLNESKRDRFEEAKNSYQAIKDELTIFLAGEASNPTLHAPYRLIHDDFEPWNILVTDEDPSSPPKISAVIDWDYAYAGPLYYLCDYPSMTLGYFRYEDEKPNDKIMRKHFVRTLARQFPKGSADRENVKRCFKEKSLVLNGFHSTFTAWKGELESEVSSTSAYLSTIRGECDDEDCHPYGLLEEWVPDSDVDSDEE